MSKSIAQTQIDILVDPSKTDGQRYEAYDALVEGFDAKKMTVTLSQFNHVADKLCCEQDTNFISSLNLLAGHLVLRPRHKFPHDLALLTVLEKMRFFFSDNYRLFNSKHKLFLSERAFDRTRFLLSQTTQMMIENVPQASLTEAVGKQICSNAISVSSVEIDSNARVILRDSDVIRMNTIAEGFARRATPTVLNQVAKYCIHHAWPEVSPSVHRSARAIELVGVFVEKLLTQPLDPQIVRKLQRLNANPDAPQAVARKAKRLHHLLNALR